MLGKAWLSEFEVENSPPVDIFEENFPKG